MPRMDVKEIRRLNLNDLVEKYTVKGLSEAVESDPSYISQIRSGTRNVGHEMARKIERGLGLDPGWMDTFHRKMTAPAAPDEAQGSELSPAVEQYSVIPLISWVQAGSFAESPDLYSVGDAEKWLPTISNVSPQAFYLRVQGDSMWNPHGEPSIPDGSIIEVEPELQADNGDLVVARINEENEATFKKLSIDGPRIYLKPLNTQYRAIDVSDRDFVIVGVVTTYHVRTK